MPDNSKVKEYKLKIGGKEYTFRLDFDALSKYQEKYDDNMMINFNVDLLQGHRQYDCIVNILCCACKEKEWNPADMRKQLAFNVPTMNLLDNIVIDMISSAFIVEGDNELKNE